MEEKPRCIMIASDDDNDVRLLISLFASDYTVQTASSGTNALCRWLQHQDDLAALFISPRCNDMSAQLMLYHAKRQGILSKAPVYLVFHDYLQEETTLDFLQLGVRDFIRLPSPAAAIKARVKTGMELCATRRSLEYGLMRKQQEAAQNTNDFLNLNVKVISSLAAAIEFRSGELGSHIHTIRLLTRAMLQKLRLNRHLSCVGMSDRTIEIISYSSIFHDIGKIAIPEAILNKPGPLTYEEYQIMKNHSKIGADIIEKMDLKQNPILEHAYDICLHHHERYDGGGYPDGLNGDEISIAAQVVGLADVFDALTQDRCYKDAFSVDDALYMIMHGQCGAFNPELLNLLPSVIRENDLDRPRSDPQFPAEDIGSLFS